MPNSNDAIITLIKKGAIILTTSLIKVTRILSCPTDFFIGNELVVLIISLSSTGSRNIEEEYLAVKYLITLWLLLLSIFPAKKNYWNVQPLSIDSHRILPFIFMLLGGEFASADFLWRSELMVFHILWQLFLLLSNSLWKCIFLESRLTFVNLLE